MRYLFLIPVLLIIGCKSTEPLKQSDCLEMSREDNIRHNALSSPFIRVPPKYPRQAAVDKVEGHVMFRFDISKDGVPINIRVIESHPSNIFVEVATDAFEQWRYAPVKVNDYNTVSECHGVQLDFKLP